MEECFFAAFVLVVAVIGQFEFYSLVKRKDYSPLTIPGMVTGVLWVITTLLFPQYLYVFFIAVILIFLIINLFMNIPNATNRLSSTILGFVYVPVLISSLILIRELPSNYTVIYREGEYLILLFLTTVWVCDSLAYIFGKWLGKKKIAPEISAKKTVVGCVAGLIGSVLSVLVLYTIRLVPESLTLLQIIVFSLLMGLFGQVGDFVESVFKRDAQVKDSSSILLGHGGILDRFDSFLVAAPVAYLYFLLLLNF